MVRSDDSQAVLAIGDLAHHDDRCPADPLEQCERTDLREKRCHEKEGRYKEGRRGGQIPPAGYSRLEHESVYRRALDGAREGPTQRDSIAAMLGQTMTRRSPRPVRALRALVPGEAPQTGEIARRLSGLGVAEVTSLRTTSDVIILWDPEPPAVREIALWAARSCPHTVLIIAARAGLTLCREASRSSGLAPRLILTTGGIPHADRERRMLARRIDACATQTSVPVIGGDAPIGTEPVRRYITVAGIAADALGYPGEPEWPSHTPARPCGDIALITAAVTLARAVLEDRRQVLSCGAWVERAWGIPGGFVIAPVPVGAQGAGEPLPMSLTIEERSLLQRGVVVP